MLGFTVQINGQAQATMTITPIAGLFKSESFSASLRNIHPASTNAGSSFVSQATITITANCQIYTCFGYPSYLTVGLIESWQNANEPDLYTRFHKLNNIQLTNSIIGKVKS